MFDFLDFKDDWKPYMPGTRVSPLGGQSFGLMSPVAKRPQPQQEGGSNLSFPNMPQPSTGAAGGGSRKKSSRRKETTEDVVRPSETYEPDYSSHNTANTKDPYNPNNWEYSAESGEYQWSGDDSLNPGNWHWDEGTGNFVSETPSFWENTRPYEGTLYDPSNPFDLTENEWIAMQGAFNSGSLLEEGMGLAKNANLAGGLSDMGGVADEIVNQTGSGLMGDAFSSFGELLPWIGAAYGIFNSAKGGGGGKGTASTAMTTIGPIIGGPMGAVMTAGGVLLKADDYFRSKGRQYDYYHPVLNQYTTDANGNIIADFGFVDKESRANDLNARNLEYDGLWGSGFTPEGAFGNGGNGNLVAFNNETGEQYWMNSIADYLGTLSYDDYAESHGGYTNDDAFMDYAGMGGGRFNNNAELGLMDRESYQNRLNDMFMAEIAKNGIDFSNQAFSKGNSGMFKNSLVTDIGGRGSDPETLVRIAEMANLLDGGPGRDLSGYMNYQYSDIPTTVPTQKYLNEHEYLGDYASI